MDRLKAFITSFAQVGLISAQVKFLQQNAYIPIFCVSMCISICWLFNVNVAVGKDRLAKISYVIGAATGAVTTTWFINYIMEVLKW